MMGRSEDIIPVGNVRGIVWKEICPRSAEREGVEMPAQTIPAGRVRILQTKTGFELRIAGDTYFLSVGNLIDQALKQVQINQEAHAKAGA